MTESEYINATNLAKVRMAEEILWDYFPNGEEYDTHYFSALLSVRKLVDELYAVVSRSTK